VSQSQFLSDREREREPPLQAMPYFVFLSLSAKR
jgi:hypothetical protein